MMLVWMLRKEIGTIASFVFSHEHLLCLSTLLKRVEYTLRSVNSIFPSL